MRIGYDLKGGRVSIRLSRQELKALCRAMTVLEKAAFHERNNSPEDREFTKASDALAVVVSGHAAGEADDDGNDDMPA